MYIDEMVKGPFKKWKHVHLFSEIGENQTVITDKIEFELPFFFLGKLMEGYVENNLKKIFEFRKIQTVSYLSNKSADEQALFPSGKIDKLLVNMIKMEKNEEDFTA